MLVPQVDADGNERDGVRLPEITVPLATYTSWNLRDPSIGAPDQRVAFEASYLPFPKTAAERQKTGDPRKSIAERYSDRDDYLSKYTRRWTNWSRNGGSPEKTAAPCSSGRTGMARSQKVITMYWQNDQKYRLRARPNALTCRFGALLESF